MTTSLEGLDLAALDRHLRDAGIPRTGELRAELIAGGRSNLTFLVSDDASKWVLRRPPLHGLTPSAHDMAREYRVVAALAGHPRAGRARRHDAQRRLRARRAVPDGGVRARPRRAPRRRARGARRQGHHQRLRRRADHRCSPICMRSTPTRSGSATSASPAATSNARCAGGARSGIWSRREDDPCDDDVKRLHSALAQAIPPQSRSAIVHGDYRIDNTILDADDATKVVAVLDWEMSTLGDPLSDAALMCVYRHPMFNLVHADSAWASPLIPAADELAEPYSRGGRSDAGQLGLLHGAGLLQGGDHRRGHRVPGPHGRWRRRRHRQGRRGGRPAGRRAGLTRAGAVAATGRP